MQSRGGVCGGPAASSGFLASSPGLNFWDRAVGRDRNGDRNLGLDLEVAILVSGLLCSAGSRRQVAECGGRGGNRTSAWTLSVRGPHWRLPSVPRIYFRSFFSGGKKKHKKLRIILRQGVRYSRLRPSSSCQPLTLSNFLGPRIFYI